MKFPDMNLSASADELCQVYARLCAPHVFDLARRALQEDVGAGDITTAALIPAARRAQAAIVSRGDYVVAGGAVARAVYDALDPGVRCEISIPDGRSVGPGQAILTLAGAAASILTGERTALNFMQRMTGIATLTAQFVAKARPYGVVILDTRKTTPNLRALEKYAVRCGGGANHRLGLFDMVLIKDNHRRLWTADAGRSLAGAVAEARRKYPEAPVEIEVETEAELQVVLSAAPPDWVLLDNMTPEQMRRCVAVCAGRCRLEASGGITLKNIAAVAAAGVNAVSLGCLTHSAPAADLALELLD